MKQKKLMLLGGIRYLLPVIEAAHKLGAYVITADYLPDNIAHKYSDEYVNVSIIDKDAVLRVAQEKRIDGILSFGVDPGVVTAAYVAEKMGLPSPPLKSVEILQNKDKFRDFLEANGFNCPWHKGYLSKDEALHDFSANPEWFPVIVKPVDSAGSKGCSRVASFRDLAGAVDIAITASHSKKYIVEQYLDGIQMGSDCFVLNNKLVYCTFGKQVFDVAAVNQLAPIANIWPADIPLVKQCELESEIQRLVKLLDLKTSILNIETRIAKDGRAYIMEVSPRGGGNRIAEVLSYATGQDLILADVLFALGHSESIKLDKPIYKDVWAYYILHSDFSGIYAGAAEIEHGFKRRHVIDFDDWCSKGQKISAFTGANQALGTLILRFDSFQEADMALRSAKEWLDMNILKI